MRDTTIKHEPQDPCAERWPQWTSGGDVSKQPPEWCYTCSYGPLITMRPSDGQYATTFQKWSSQTACSIGRIIDNVQLHFTRSRRFTRLRCEMRHGHTIYMANAQDVVPSAKTWPAEHCTNTWTPGAKCSGMAPVELGTSKLIIQELT